MIAAFSNSCFITDESPQCDGERRVMSRAFNRRFAPAAMQLDPMLYMLRQRDVWT